jgi:hypothetical protein
LPFSLEKDFPMKTLQYLIPVLGAAAIFTFVSFAAEKPPTHISAPQYVPGGLIPSDTPARTAEAAETPSRLEMQKILDAHPDLVQWLLDRVGSKNDGIEQQYTSAALLAIVPFAGEELLKALENPKLAVRLGAMSLLSEGAALPGFPRKEAVSLLLKIARDENEDEQVRKLATMTACQFIHCIIKGHPIQASFGPSAG